MHLFKSYFFLLIGNPPTSNTASEMYKHLLLEYPDGPVNYFIETHRRGNFLEICPMVYFYISESDIAMETKSCPKSNFIMCQRRVETNSRVSSVTLNNVLAVSFENLEVDTVSCPKGHRTMSYLQCDAKSQCYNQGITF